MEVITANGKFPGKPLEGKMEYAKLYHYTSLHSFREIWKSKTLRFGETNKLNDFNESVKYYTIPFLPSINEKMYMKNAEFINNCINSFKQISLTKDYDSNVKGCMSPMMWGHYGDKAEGVCLELDFNKIIFPDNTYYDSVIYEELINNYIEFPCSVDIDAEKANDLIVEYLKDLFFIKTKDWSGENEFRVISNKDSYLNIKDAISTVYVTKCDSKTCLDVEKIINSEIPVKFMHRSSTPLRIYELCETKGHREDLLGPKEMKLSPFIRLMHSWIHLFFGPKKMKLSHNRSKRID